MTSKHPDPAYQREHGLCRTRCSICDPIKEEKENRDVR